MDISISATLYSLSPLIFVLCAQWMFSGDNRYQRMGAVEFALFAVAFAGAALAIASQADEIELGGGIALGATLAVGAARLAAITSVDFRWSVDCARELARNAGQADLEFFCCLLGMVFCGAILSPLMLAAGGRARRCA